VKIKVIEPIAVSLPMKKPVQMAGETVARADNVLVRIENAEGVVGWGEAASAPVMTGETVASMMAAVEHMAAGLLARDAFDLAGAAAAMEARMYGNNGAKAAIDIALHDVVGRATGRPVYALLGGKHRTRMAVLAVIGSLDAAADIREAQERFATGYRAFKIKVGIASARADAERTRAITTALKGMGECLVSADANQGFGVDAALDYVRAVDGCGLDFFEQPVQAHDLDGMYFKEMARVAAASRLPIGADEGLHSRDDIARHHGENAAQGGSLKAIKLGGLRALLEASRLCDRLGMKVNISCKTGESSVASAAAAHAAAAAPAIAWGLTVTNAGLAEDVAVEPLRIVGGHVEVPDGPGLGIEVDERRVRRCQQEFRARLVA
jgi:L-alanine-DL-glutamate epimerase-like enolase superfamily enzyme